MSFGGGYGGGAQDFMQVESSHVGRIIGRGGCKIRELEQESNARIKISRDEDENGMKSVEISGTDDEVRTARSMIEECLSSDFSGGGGGRRGGGSFGGRGGGRSGGGGFGGRRDDGGGWGRRDRDGGDGWGGRRNDYDRGDRGGGGRGFSSGDETESIYVEKTEVGRIIGRGGSRIRDMEAESGCKIKVSRDGSSSSEVVLEGSRQSIGVAKQLILDTGVEILDGPDDSSQQQARGW